MPTRRAVLAGLMAMLLPPYRARAAGRPAAAFAATSLDAALHALYGGRRFVRDPGFVVEAPARADNAAQVPVTLHAEGRAVRAFALYAEHNPVPLIARWQLADDAEPWLALRIKLAATGRVIALAETADGTLLYAEARVEVGAGACG